MTLKNGTNEFHGNVFEFLRNEKLDANGFFRNRSAATAKRAPFKRNILFGSPGHDITALSTFGAITPQVTPVSNIQFGLKYYF